MRTAQGDVMCRAAYQFVKEHRRDLYVRVVEIGSLPDFIVAGQAEHQSVEESAMMLVAELLGWTP